MTEDPTFPMTPPPLLDDAAAYRAHRDDAETLAHLDLLQRQRTRISYQLSAAREQVADLERAMQTATDDLNLAQAQYLNDAARPLSQT